MSISQKVYAELIEAIRDGRFGPGDRVRAEDVAKALNVSRTPVREALSRLQERGLLEASSSGLAVAKLERHAVLELYDMRELLEGSAARFAAQHASASDLYAMRQIAAVFAEPSNDHSRVARLNRAFHSAIQEAAHNRYLISMLDGMHDTLMLLPSTTFAVQGRQELAVKEHHEILNAIERRDPEAAERLARDHIRKARDTRLGMMFHYESSGGGKAAPFSSAIETSGARSGRR